MPLRGEALESRLVLSLSSTDWTPIGPAPVKADEGYSGRIVGVAADPTDAKTIYIAAAGGGVWKITDGGSTWNPLTDVRRRSRWARSLSHPATTM